MVDILFVMIKRVASGKGKRKRGNGLNVPD